MAVLSIVSTLYCSADFVRELTRRVTKSAEAVTSNFEIIYVDDGSPDDSLMIALEEAKNDRRISIIELSRNFGHHPAILAGLEAASGTRVFYIDSDLEEAPEYLVEFNRHMDEMECDVVFGIHRHTGGSFMRRISSRLYWRLFNVLSDTKTVPDICNIRLMSRSYVDALLAMSERNVFLGGMFAWPGFRQTSLLVERQMRRTRSTYGWRRRITLFGRSIVSFSTQPLKIVFFLGTTIALVSFASAFAIAVVKIIHPTTIVKGYTALLVSIWLLSGLILMSLGLVGLYVAYVYQEVKGRPRAIVRRLHRFDIPAA